MGVYAPTGSGGAHIDTVISGGRKQPKAGVGMAKKVAKKGMGFKAAAKATGLPAAQANAVIASGARNASPAAKKANPNLKKVTAKKATKKAGSGVAKGMPRPTQGSASPGGY